MEQEKHWLKIDTYNAVRLSEYRGKWSIMAGSRGDNDTYDKWCNPLKWHNGENVAVKKKDGDLLVLPFQVLLGEKDQAINILKNILRELETR